MYSFKISSYAMGLIMGAVISSIAFLVFSGMYEVQVTSDPAYDGNCTTEKMCNLYQELDVEIRKFQDKLDYCLEKRIVRDELCRLWAEKELTNER